VFHLGYGGSGCLYDDGSRFETGAEYNYPYLTLEASFMPYEPHIRMWLASSILFNAETSEEHAEGSYLGLKVGAGVDLLPTNYIYLGMGYELARYYDGDWSSDLFVSFFLRAGCYYN